MIAKNECNDEEGDTQKDSHSRNDMNKVCNFFGNRGLASVQTRGKSGNAPHDCIVTNIDDNTTSSSFNSIGGKEGQISRF